MIDVTEILVHWHAERSQAEIASSLSGPGWCRPAPVSSGIWSSCKSSARTRPTGAAATVSRRMKAARFDEQVSLEEFDFTVSAKLPVATLRDLATLRFLDRGESIVLHGPVGVGKSWSSEETAP